MLTVLGGDALEQLTTLPGESVQCCVTSPPYWGLRDYGTATWKGGEERCDHRFRDAERDPTSTLVGTSNKEGFALNNYRHECGKCGARRVDSQIGLEKTPAQYVEQIVGVMREVRRVLRKDGTLWLNLSSSYFGSGQGGNPEDSPHQKQRTNRGSFSYDKRPIRSPSGGSARRRKDKDVSGLAYSTITFPQFKAKDLVPIPWMVAMALQADGWYLRQDIIWAKPNPMPESVTDRPTKAHEYIFLLTKSAQYFYDAEAIKEPGVELPRTREANNGESAVLRKERGFDNCMGTTGSRNKRTVWSVPTNPYPEAHFATFPPEIPKLCILAGTSARGCCSKCGAPWERVVERVDSGRTQKMADGWDTGEGAHGTIHRNGREKGETGVPVMESKTTGWQPTCSCNAEVTPCTVLDPFAGSGTTGQVALELGRRAILIELSPAYAKLIEARCTTTIGLPL